jgi:hypothetical protein
MGDAGEGLIDAEARIQERIDESERERARARPQAVPDPDRARAFESLRLARTELERQLAATSHDWRRQQLQQAIDEVERRMSETSG